MKRKQPITDDVRATPSIKTLGALAIRSLLSLIFSFVVEKWPDVFTLQQTCHTWHNLDLYTTIPPIRQKTMHIASRYSKATDFTFVDVAPRFLVSFFNLHSIVNLTIWFANIGTGENNVDFSSLSTCKRLTLMHPLDKQHIFPPNLEYLDIGNPKNEKMIPFKVIETMHLHYLRHLVLGPHNATSINWQLPLLEEAELVFTESQSMCDYTTLFQTIPSTCEISCSTFPFKAHNFPFHCIIAFSLGTVSNFEDSLVHFSKCTKVRCIAFRNIKYGDLNAEFQRMAPFPRLRVLELTNCRFINGKFLSHCKLLDELILEDTCLDFDHEQFHESISITMKFTESFQEDLVPDELTVS